MYKLIEYSSNYSEITGSLWFYCKDEATDFNDNIANWCFDSFMYKTILLGITKVDGAKKNFKQCNNYWLLSWIETYMALGFCNKC